MNIWLLLYYTWTLLETFDILWQVFHLFISLKMVSVLVSLISSSKTICCWWWWWWFWNIYVKLLVVELHQNSTLFYHTLLLLFIYDLTSTQMFYYILCFWHTFSTFIIVVWPGRNCITITITTEHWNTTVILRFQDSVKRVY